MGTDAKEFIDFWMEVSVQARTELGLPGSSQNSQALADRLLNAAKDQGLSVDDIIREIGDPADYIKGKLDEANLAEVDRRKPKH